MLVQGSAGTGKSMLLRRLFEGSANRHVEVLSFTGLAALLVGGRTIHSYFGFVPDLQERSRLALCSATPEQEELRSQRLRDLGALLVDEVSMVRADLFDAMDAVLRDRGPRPGEPFGGVQIGLFGDVLQLPPIVEANVLPAFNGQWEDGWPSPWFFDACAFRDSRFERVTLGRVFRQDQGDDGFARFLRRLREARLQPEDFTLAHSRVFDAAPAGSLTLVTTNRLAEETNTREFDQLPGPVGAYSAKYDDWPDDWPDGPVANTVEVKEGARVLVCANGAGPGLVNGSLGKVVRFDDQEVVVDVDGIERPVRRYTWVKPVWQWNRKEARMQKTGEARFTQMPLRLAWAMTIHKAQGQTVDGPMWVDFGHGTWDGGQAYVALSRVRRLDQLHLRRRLTAGDVRLSRRAADFLALGDSPTTVEEVRAKGAKVYRATKRLQGEALTARDRTETVLAEVRAALKAMQEMTAENRRAAERAEAASREAARSLEEMRKGWLRLLFRG